MSDLILELPYPPSVNKMYNYFRGRVVKSAIAKRYQDCVRLLCAAKKVKPLSGPVVLQFDVWRPERRGDLDNLQKIAFDALNGFAWDDDSQIVQILARRFEDPARPRVIVSVSLSPDFKSC